MERSPFTKKEVLTIIREKDIMTVDQLYKEFGEEVCCLMPKTSLNDEVVNRYFVFLYAKDGFMIIFHNLEGTPPMIKPQTNRNIKDMIMSLKLACGLKEEGIKKIEKVCFQLKKKDQAKENEPSASSVSIKELIRSEYEEFEEYKKKYKSFPYFFCVPHLNEKENICSFLIAGVDEELYKMPVLYCQHNQIFIVKIKSREKIEPEDLFQHKFQLEKVVERLNFIIEKQKIREIFTKKPI